MKFFLKKSRTAAHFFFFALIFSVFFLSCASQEEAAEPEAEPAPEPELSIENIELIGMSFEHLELLVDLCVSNPAPFDISPSELNYSMEVGGELFFSGRSQDIQRVPGESRLALSLPVKLETEKIQKISERAGKIGEFDYTLHTVTKVPMPLTGIPLRLSRSHSGTFPLPLLPKIGVAKVDIKDFGATIISFELGLQVLNPNVFAVTCGKISYDFQVDEESWISGTSGKSYDLAPGKVKDIPVQLRFDYLQAGRRIVDVLVGDKTLDYVILGDASASFAWKNIDVGPLPFEYRTEGTAEIIRPEKFGF